MSIWQLARPPKTPLGVHRILSPLSGLRVSPLCLGAMSIGDAWNTFMGSMDKKQSFELLDAFYEAGGNFIDTSNNYQNEQSEEWIGEWMEKRTGERAAGGGHIRDELVIATKFTTNHRQYQLGDIEHAISSNYGGNHTKSLHLSVRDSLKKLKTDYIDILYLHWWDFSTSVEEIMRSLDALVKSGKVMYLGVSDTPAWIVSKANQYARDHGLTPFVIYQGLWNVMLRDFENEIIPMCISEGLAIAPWGAMGQGKFQSTKDIEERKKSGETLRSTWGANQSEQEVKTSAALEKVAGELGDGVTVTAVALAYVLQRCPHVFPIIGGRKISHLQDNIKSLEITLSEEQINYLESQSSAGHKTFPHTMIGEDPHRTGESQMFLVKSYANLKWVKQSPAISGTKL